MCDIILKYGFRTIFSTVGGVSSYSKGKNLADSGHVLEITERIDNAKYSIINAKVIRQTSIHLPAVDVELEVDCNRYVKVAKCSCLAGIAGMCKHICAVVHTINNERSASKTSEEQEWHKPSARQMQLEKYAKGKRCEELFPQKAKKEIAPYNLKYEHVKDIPCALRANLHEEEKSVTHRLCQHILLQDIIPAAWDKILAHNCELIVGQCLENQNQLSIYSSVSTFQNDLQKSFYYEKIAVSNRQIKDKCLQTIGQADCTQWFEERRLRVSASEKAHSIKTRRSKYEDLADKLLESKVLEGKAAHNVEYGKMNEFKALRQYEQMFKCNVIQCGLIIHNKQPWLCACPDAMLTINSKVVKVLEMKCPISCKNKLIVDESRNINVSYLHFEGDKLTLKPTHKYYTQSQILMYCCGLTACDFFVFSQRQSECVVVERNELFLKENIPKLDKFYFTHMLGRICDRN